MTIRRSRAVILISIIVSVCTACGGGGGGGGGGGDSSSNTNGNLAPTISLPNEDQTAYTFIDFSYDASQAGATFSDAGALTYTVAFSPAVNGLSATGAVISGEISSATNIAVSVTATDSSGASAVDNFRIVGLESRAVVESCPANGSLDTPINSSIRLALDSDIDAPMIGNNSIEVTCGSEIVTGEVSVGTAETLVFRPNSNLPAFDSCSVSVLNVPGVDGRPLRPSVWSFETNNQVQEDWLAELTAPLLTLEREGGTRPQFDNLYSYSEGDTHLVLYSVVGNLFVSVSEDNGQTYRTSEKLLPEIYESVSKDDFDYDYKDGQFFISFRIPGRSSVTGIQTFEVAYLQSLDDLLSYSAPAILTNGDDLLSVLDLGVAVSDDTIFITWQNGECFGCASDTPGQGIFLAEYDKLSGELIWSGKVGDGDRDLEISFAEDLVLTWSRNTDFIGTPNYVHELYNHSEGTTQELNLSTQGFAPYFIGKMLRIGPDEIFRSWAWSSLQQTITNIDSFVYNTSSELLEYRQPSAVLDSRFGACLLVQATDRNGSIAVSYRDFGFDLGVAGPVYFSTDAGKSFSKAMDTNFWVRGWCPTLAVKDEATVFVTEVDTGQQLDPDTSVLNSIRYAKKAPCEL